VVFSFFKKDPKDTKDRSARAGAGARAKPGPSVGRSAASAGAKSPGARSGTTENSVSARDFHRTLAMETAAKIDAIESEMTRDFLRPVGARAANSAFPRGGAGAPKVAPPAVLGHGSGASADLSDDDLGNIDAIEINTSGAGSVIDETAILFANGQAKEAQVGLRAALENNTVGPNVQTAWQMLFELVNQAGDRESFEQLTLDYVARYGNSPPSWIDYENHPPSTSAAPAPVLSTPPALEMGGAPVVRLPTVVDAGIVKSLEELKAHATVHPALVLDVTAARSVDLVGAELLLRVLNAFKRAAHELTFVGLEQLCVALRSSVTPGRRDPSDAAWMLLLEVLRLLENQHDFEETGIQYCVTFEVSPPSWEPISPNIKVVAATPERLAAAAALVAGGPTAQASDHPLQWRGVIEGEGEPHFGRLAVAARNGPENARLIVECRHLRRMVFSAGSALLSLALRLQQAGIQLEFQNVNALVGALLHLLGVTAVATVHLRRD